MVRWGALYHVSAGDQRTNREAITSILRQLDQPESLMMRVTDRWGTIAAMPTTAA